MKKVILFFTIIILFNGVKLNAQTLDIKWSAPIPFDNELGRLAGQKGANSKKLYVKFESDKKYKLIAYDKNTLDKVNEVVVWDKRTANKKMGDYGWYKTIVFENSIFVLWYKESRKMDELYAACYDNNLNLIFDFKKIYEIASEKGKEKKAEIFIEENIKNEKIIIGAEKSTEKGERLKIEFKIFDANLSAIAENNNITLPIIVIAKSNKLSCDYKLGNDGNLHIKCNLKINKEQSEDLKKGQNDYFPIYSIINTITGAVKTFNMKFDNRNVFNCNFIEDSNSVKILGFFSDLNKDKKGINIDGFFYGIIDSKTFNFKEDLRFNYFTKEQLSILFSNVLDSVKNDLVFSFGKKKRVIEPYISSEEFNIESIHSLDNDNLVLFCCNTGNYSEERSYTGSNGATNRYLLKRSIKANICAIKIKENGQIDWMSNLDRTAVYPGWNVQDLKVISRNNKFYVCFGSSEKIDIDNPYKIDKGIYYAIFDYTNGNYKKAFSELSIKETIEKEKKEFLQENLLILNNDIYTVDFSSTRKKRGVDFMGKFIIK